MALKWILEDDTILFGNVQYHRELKTDGRDVKGGGFFYRREPETKDGNLVYILYGKSEDFGKITDEEFLKAQIKIPFRETAKKIVFKFSSGTFLLDILREEVLGKTMVETVIQNP